MYKKGKHSWDKDSVPLIMDKHQDFFLGYKLGIEYLIKCFTGPDYMNFKGVSRLTLSADWEDFNKLFSKIRSEDIEPGLLKLEESSYPDSFFKTNNIHESLSTLCTSRLFKEKPKTVNEKLDELFMWYEVSMLDVGNNVLGFTTILKGYSSFGTNNIQIIKLAHPQQGVDGNNYSFAILIESFGLFTDSCYWLLFYNFATDYSGTGGSCFQEVLKQLKGLSTRVHVIEASVDEEALLTYLESYRVKKLVTRGQ